MAALLLMKEEGTVTQIRRFLGTGKWKNTQRKDVREAEHLKRIFKSFAANPLISLPRGLFISSSVPKLVQDRKRPFP